MPTQGPSVCPCLGVGCGCGTFAGPVVGVQDVAEPAGAVVPANVVVAIVVTSQLLITLLLALIHI